MDKNKLIAIKEETKDNLDKIKLCPEESYNSLLSRLIQLFKDKSEKDVQNGN